MSATFTLIDGVLRSTKLPRTVVEALCKLFAADATVPFVARYRSTEIGLDDPSKVAVAKVAYDDALATLSAREGMITKLTKHNLMTSEVLNKLNVCRTVHQLEAIYDPLKPDVSKVSLTAKATKLGLGDAATKLFDGQHAKLDRLVKSGTPGLASIADVEKGVQHILASFVVKHADVVRAVQRASGDVDSRQTTLTSKLARTSSKKDAATVDKYKQYHDASFVLSQLRPSMIAAIQRAEKAAILTVNIELGDRHKQDIQYAVRQSLNVRIPAHIRDAVIADVWSRLISPQIKRTIRSYFNDVCQRSLIDVFGRNLRQLLLQRPLGAKAVLGVDPGFGHGVKCTLVMPNGDVSHHDTIYLPPKAKSGAPSNMVLSFCRRCVSILKAARIDRLFVSVGNGTACRETEAMFAALIDDRAFGSINVQYCVTNEAGSSVYSASKCAAEELAHIPLIYRSAVSIARRLQDPMMEMIKIPPHSIGVGMYQHDVAEAKLTKAAVVQLEQVVSDIGVDINTANVQLLQRVPGIGPSLAAKCVAHRTQYGRFVCRQQLSEVKGMGKKAFEQCAGFVTVQPGEETGEPRAKKSKRSAPSFNPLDATIVHPESYAIADTLVREMGFTPAAIGQGKLCTAMRSPSPSIVSSVASTHGVAELRVKHVAEMLAKPARYDFRDESMGALFRAGVTDVESLKVGEEMSGAVSNVADFGAFVDIGCGRDALIPRSTIPKGMVLHELLQVGHRISVKILNVVTKPQVKIANNETLLFLTGRTKAYCSVAKITCQ